MDISLIILALVGLLAYIFAKQGKTAEIGRIIFFCAILTMLLHGVHLRLTS